MALAGQCCWNRLERSLGLFVLLFQQFSGASQLQEAITTLAPTEVSGFCWCEDLCKPHQVQGHPSDAPGRAGELLPQVSAPLLPSPSLCPAVPASLCPGPFQPKLFPDSVLPPACWEQLRGWRSDPALRACSPVSHWLYLKFSHSLSRGTSPAAPSIDRKSW